MTTTQPQSTAYPRLWQAFTAQVWALEPRFLRSMLDVLDFRRAGGRLDALDISARLTAAAAANGPRQGGQQVSGDAGYVAVIPLYGPIAARIGTMGDISGGTSCEALSQALRDAVNDASVGAIVLDVDSPGGSVFGVPELADEIYRARSAKPVVAVANNFAASAAYYLASAAGEVSMTPSAEVGSIGVYMVHEDWSQAYANEGIVPTLIKAGDHKAELLDCFPLSESARAYEQGRIDDYYRAFVADVARFRGHSTEDIEANFGQGRVMGAQQALAVGAVDRIETLSAAVERMMRRRPKSAGAGARPAATATDVQRAAQALVASRLTRLHAQ